MQKKIGINMISIPEQKAGVGFLAVNLVKSLIRERSDRKFIIFNAKGRYFPELQSDNTQQIKIAPEGIVRRLIWEQITFPGILKKENIETLLNPHYTASLFTSKHVKQITIIHDLTYQKFPLHREIWKSIYFSIFIPLSLWKSQNIIANSHYTKNEILKTYPLTNSNKIKVMHLGPGNKVSIKNTREEESQVLKKYTLEKQNYFLFVSVVEPTKNLLTNLQAFKHVLIVYPELKFVVIGKIGWRNNKNKYYQKISKFIMNNNLKQSVIFTGYLENNDFGVLFSNTRCLVYTSLNEGFGMPLLEAMAYNVPIITSDISCMPEVVGDAAIKVNPYSAHEITQAMITMVENNDTRTRLIEAGEKQLNKYSWQKSAELIADLF